MTDLISIFQRNIVAYNENSQPKLNDAVLLQDAISDLPPVYLLFSQMLSDHFHTSSITNYRTFSSR
mgnify:CR=1 FL=1